MKNILCLVIAGLLFFPHGHASGNPYLFIEESEGSLTILKIGKQQYCVTTKELFHVGKKTLESKIALQFICNDAVAYKGNILMAGTTGIYLYNTKLKIVTPFLSAQINGTINQIKTDANDNIWFIKKFEGCFVINRKNEVYQKIKVPVTYAMAYTNDSSIWVGTNIGLYKLDISGKEVERYAEEGIASKELPDNLVEQLFSDTRSRVWAIMPGHISLITSGNDNEIQDYEFLSRKESEVYHISGVSSSANAYLFSTSQGVLLMQGNISSDDMHLGEIHQVLGERAYLLTDDIIQKPILLKKDTVKSIINCGKKTYFTTNKGFWSVNSLKLIRSIKNHFELPAFK